MAFGYRNPTSPSRGGAPRRMNPKAQPMAPKEVLPEPTVDYSAQDNPELPHEIVMFIVQSFACWHTAPEICDMVLREFGARIQPQQIYKLDPSRPASKDPAEELVKLYDETREEYRDAVSDLPIANRVWRMRELQKMYERASDEIHGNEKLALQALEQAAKEQADYYKRAFSVDHTTGGQALPPAFNITFVSPKKVFEPPIEVIDAEVINPRELTDGRS